MILYGLSRGLGSNLTVLFSVVLLNLSVFYFVERLIKEGKSKRGIFLLLFAVINSIACLNLEIYSKGASNLLIISIITAFLITEISLIYKGRALIYWGVTGSLHYCYNMLIYSAVP